MKRGHKLITKAQTDRLLRNGVLTREAQERGEDEPDHRPVVKLFSNSGRSIWLLSEIIPGTDGERAFGLCDHGMGYPELGYVSIPELAHVPMRLKINGKVRTFELIAGVERDCHWTPRGTLREYTDAARAAQGFVDLPAPRVS